MTLYLKDGTRETVFESKRNFLENLLREKLGEDVALCFNNCISEYAEKARLEQMAAEEHERIADGYHSMCNDALENFEVVLNLLQAQRINKQKLLEAAKHGYNDLYNNL